MSRHALHPLYAARCGAWLQAPGARLSPGTGWPQGGGFPHASSSSSALALSGRVKTLGEPAVDRRQELAGRGPLTKLLQAVRGNRVPQFGLRTPGGEPPQVLLKAHWRPNLGQGIWVPAAATCAAAVAQQLTLRRTPPPQKLSLVDFRQRLPLRNPATGRRNPGASPAPKKSEATSGPRDKTSSLAERTMPACQLHGARPAHAGGAVCQPRLQGLAPWRASQCLITARSPTSSASAEWSATKKRSWSREERALWYPAWGSRAGLDSPGTSRVMAGKRVALFPPISCPSRMAGSGASRGSYACQTCSVSRAGTNIEMLAGDPSIKWPATTAAVSSRRTAEREVLPACRRIEPHASST